MSIRQDRLVKAIVNDANNHKTLAEIGRDVGYSQSYSESKLYQSVSKGKLAQKISKAYDPETIKKDILKAEKDFAKDKDNSNRARMLELRARVQGLGKDSTATQVNVNINDTIAKLRANTPIDIT